MVNSIEAIIMENQSLMVRELGAMLDISKSSIQNILSKKWKTKLVSSVWVLHNLTIEKLMKQVLVFHK